MATQSKPLQTIEFALEEEAAAIVRRAAERLQLRIVDHGPGSFRVELTESIDAYRLGNLCVADPGWARLFTAANLRRP